MAIMDMFTGVPMEVMREQLGEQQKYKDALERERDSLESDLNLYNFDGYDEFKKGLLEFEKKRLAFLRMSVHTSETGKHDTLQGQYNECIVLARGETVIKQDLALNAVKIREVDGKIGMLTQKINLKIQKEKTE